MNQNKQETRGSAEPLALFSGSIFTTLLRLGGLVIIDAFALWLIYSLYLDRILFLALILLIITVIINAAFSVEKLYPFRWLSPGLALSLLVILYPLTFTVYAAFTNFKTGNLLTQPQAIQRIEEKPEYRYLPAGEQYYDATAYTDGEAEARYALWLVGRDDKSVLLAEQDGSSRAADAKDTGLEGVTLPDDIENGELSIDGYEALDAEVAASALSGELNYRYPLEHIIIQSGVDPEAAIENGYYLDPAAGLLVDYGGGDSYTATIFQNDAGDFALWLVDGKNYILARPDYPVVIEGQPQTIAFGDTQYRLLTGRERISLTQVLPTLTFGESDNPILIDAFSATRAGRFSSMYVHHDDNNTFVQAQDGYVYRAEDGTYKLDASTVPAGVDIAEAQIPTELSPGYYVVIGFDNFERLLKDERLRGPFLTIFVWTIIHATGTVIITFTLGLGLALLLNDKSLRYRKLWRSLILIPYAIPAFISTRVWRGLLDPNLGVVNDFLNSTIGTSPNWSQSATAARAAILLIQLWLGFPYMMLICTGALQALPGDIYEAAEVDGANAVQRFRRLTLPLILVMLGPLLIASFAFNFNNFNVIELYRAGGSSIPNSSVPAGYTDILITYTYAQAFGTAGGTDYAFASAISIFIFFIVAAITIFNFRFTRTWEEISQNV